MMLARGQVAQIGYCSAVRLLDFGHDSRTHNTVNEITAIDPQGQVGQFSVVSDDAGNLNVLPDRTDLTKAERYTYDFRNRLIKVEHWTNYDQQTPTWSTVVEYYYDGLNRRVLGSLTTRFLSPALSVLPRQKLQQVANSG